MESLKHEIVPNCFFIATAFKVDAKQYNSENIFSSALPSYRNMAMAWLLNKKHFLKRRVLVIAETAVADVVIVGSLSVRRLGSGQINIVWTKPNRGSHTQAGASCCYKGGTAR